MAAQRRIDLILESVRRLLRMGATANLLNLLQKQHPADLAQVYSELPERERHAAFNVLVEKNGKLAMETVSELGPEKGAELLALRSAEEIARLAQEIPSDDAAALIDHLPEELSAAVLDLIRPKPGGGVTELLEYQEKTAGRLMTTSRRSRRWRPGSPECPVGRHAAPDRCADGPPAGSPAACCWSATPPAMSTR